MANHQILITAWFFPFCLGATAIPISLGPPPVAIAPANLSLKNEVQHAIDKGIDWLKTQQNTNGAWSAEDYPAITALVLTACMGDPAETIRSNRPAFVKRGYDFLTGCVQPDGGIYRTNLANYNTSLALMALVATRDPQYDKIMRRARSFIVGQQNDLGEKGKMDTPWDGGIGYGSKGDHADMSNTLLALEALYYSEYLVKDAGGSKTLMEMKDLNWAAAIGFIQRCQNLSSHNQESWVTDDPKNKGGFVYYPGHSMAGEEKLPSGKVALRSYGSMSYAGMLSYIYAQVKRDDPRVQAVYDWLRNNFTLDENPGMAAQGLYYYYHLMAKTLSVYGEDVLVLNDGKTIRWRDELAKRLLDLQDNKGYWVNRNNRWWEKDPVLVTAYTIIALDYIAIGMRSGPGDVLDR